VLHRCSNHPGQRQLQNVTDQLLQANNFDVDDIILVVYKQWVHDDNTKIISMTNTAEEFNEEIY
jgi:hypothetical protein